MKHRQALQYQAEKNIQKLKKALRAKSQYYRQLSTEFPIDIAYPSTAYYNKVSLRYTYLHET